MADRFVGRPIIRSNPLPIAKFIDLSFIGEVEPVCNSLLSLVNAVNQSKSVNDAKQNFLTTVIQIPGFWKPAQKDLPKICRVFHSNLDLGFHPAQQIIPHFEDQCRKSYALWEDIVFRN